MVAESGNIMSALAKAPVVEGPSEDGIISKMDCTSRRIREEESMSRAKYFPVPKFDFPDFDALTDSVPQRRHRLTMKKRPRSEGLTVPPSPPLARAFRRIRARESELPSLPANDTLAIAPPVLIQPITKKLAPSPPRKKAPGPRGD